MSVVCLRMDSDFQGVFGSGPDQAFAGPESQCIDLTRCGNLFQLVWPVCDSVTEGFLCRVTPVPPL